MSGKRERIFGRRRFLAGGLAAGAAGAALGARPASAADASCNGFPRAAFDDYIAIFNSGGSDDYGKFYAEDVVLARGPLRLEGRAAILDFYRTFHASVHQHIEVKDYIANGDRLAVELLAKFEAFADWSHPVAGSMTKGLSRTSNTFVHYHLRDGKFVLIRSAAFGRSA